MTDQKPTEKPVKKTKATLNIKPDSARVVEIFADNDTQETPTFVIQAIDTEGNPVQTKKTYPEEVKAGRALKVMAAYWAKHEGKANPKNWTAF